MSNIIIVDDSDDLLEVMKYFLEEKGYVIETCNNKTNLLSLLSSFSPDLIILDIFLVGEDGREICKMLKQNPDTKDLCILLFSASPKFLYNYHECCADGVIEKPFGLNEIVDKIETVMSICKNSISQ